MTASLIIALLALWVVLLAAAIVGGMLFSVKRRWRSAAACGSAVALLAAVGLAGVIGMGAKGLRSAWNHTVAPWKQERERKSAEKVKRWADNIASRKALADPELLPKAPEDFFIYAGFRDW